MTRTPPTLEELVRHPERVTEVARDTVPGLLAEVERLRVALWARLFEVQERGGGPQPATRLLTAPQVAEALGVPVSYISELARSGRLPAVRFGKSFKLQRYRLQTSVDVFNLLNSSAILSQNNTYGTSWLSPTQILQGRLIKFGMQLEF